MAAKKQESKRISFLDWVKWIAVVVVVAIGVVGNMYFKGMISLPIRIAVLILLAIVVLLIAYTTEKGKVMWDFIKNSRLEMRKVVWPTRQETIHTSMIVIGIVIVTALLLWGIDSIFALAISSLVM